MTTTDVSTASPEPNPGVLIALATMDEKIQSDLAGIKAMRALQAVLRQREGLPEAEVLDPEKHSAIIRTGTYTVVHLALPDGTTAALRGTTVTLVEKKLHGRKILQIELYDGSLDISPALPRAGTDGTTGTTVDQPDEHPGKDSP